MEFKGTKGQWLANRLFSKVWADDIHICDLGVNAGNGDFTFEKYKANALLISKAPEMLEMLLICKQDFETKISQSPARDARIEQLEKLIKEATEI